MTDETRDTIALELTKSVLAKCDDLGSVSQVASFKAYDIATLFKVIRAELIEDGEADA